MLPVYICEDDREILEAERSWLEKQILIEALDMEIVLCTDSPEELLERLSCESRQGIYRPDRSKNQGGGAEKRGALSILMPGQMAKLYGQPVSLWMTLCQYVLLGGSVLCWILLLVSGKNRRAAYGLGGKRWGVSILCILVFLVLYFGRAAIAYVLSGQAGVMADILTSPETWGYMLFLPVNFILAFTAFLGEEYGWRYYMQPLLQKRFGLRQGVLILGVAWGLWHLFLDFFYYTTPDKGLVMLTSQMITCVTLGIFFAWAYLKTNNIWVPVILHYLNNNLTLVVANNYSAEVLENQQITWAMIPAQLLLNGVLFGLFLLSKEFRRKQ